MEAVQYETYMEEHLDLNYSVKVVDHFFFSWFGVLFYCYLYAIFEAQIQSIEPSTINFKGRKYSYVNRHSL